MLRSSPAEVRHTLATLFNAEVTEHETIRDVVRIEVKGPVARETSDFAVLLDVGCAEAVLRGADVFVPGVLASTSNFPAGALVSLYYSATPCLRGSKLCVVPSDSLFLGNGVAAIARNAIFAAEKGLAIRVHQGVFEAPALNGVLPGIAFPQHLPCVVAGHVLAPTSEDTVLDMCAAPGGKTTHLSTLMKNQGQIVALERSRKRCEELKENLRIWGAENVQVYALDATKATQKFPPHSFTKVLLDAPCSGLGQRPQLAFKTVDPTAAASYQRRLLQEAATLLHPSGSLVYSTCTVTSAENEENVVWALQHLPLVLQPQVPMVGASAGPQGLCQFFDPTAHGVGFFIASFRKLALES